MTHFDQIYVRAIGAMDNALRVFDHANLLSQALRRNQDSTTGLANNATDQERDFRNRLIEIFGYPYSDDIGPTGTYPSGYEGPDLYHYMYADRSELTGTEAPVPGATSQLFEGFFLQLPGIGFFVPPVIELPSPLEEFEDEVLQVQYEFSLDGAGIFSKPANWLGQRRAPGEIQMSISDLLQNRARFQKAIVDHDNLLRKIEDASDLLQAQYNLNAEEIRIKNAERDEVVNLNRLIVAAKAAALGFQAVRTSSTVLARTWQNACPRAWARPRT
jgi:hypothetical protein